MNALPVLRILTSAMAVARVVGCEPETPKGKRDLPRLRKSFKVGKRGRLNVSRSGLGVSVGGKGLRFGIGPRGARLTYKNPITGKSRQIRSSSTTKPARTRRQPDRPAAAVPVPVVDRHTVRIETFHGKHDEHVASVIKRMGKAGWALAGLRAMEKTKERTVTALDFKRERKRSEKKAPKPPVKSVVQHRRKWLFF